MEIVSFLWNREMRNHSTANETGLFFHAARNMSHFAKPICACVQASPSPTSRRFEDNSSYGIANMVIFIIFFCVKIREFTGYELWKFYTQKTTGSKNITPIKLEFAAPLSFP